MIDEGAPHPPIVSREEWEKSRAELLEQEKELTRHGDRVSAARRRQPMTPVPNYEFEAPFGPMTLRGLFGDRRQLIVQHFMFHPDWDAGCPSCSNLADNVPQLAHFEPYEVAFVRISRAPIDKLIDYRLRMGWSAPWVSSAHNSFNTDWGWTVDDDEVPGVSWYLRVGDDVFLTYCTQGRGVEPLSGLVGYLDRTVYGRQEDWEDSPAGWPQGDPYTRNRRHDEYPH